MQCQDMEKRFCYIQKAVNCRLLFFLLYLTVYNRVE